MKITYIKHIRIKMIILVTLVFLAAVMGIYSKFEAYGNFPLRLVPQSGILYTREYYLIKERSFWIKLFSYGLQILLLAS